MWLWAEAIACYSLCTGAAEARVEARADVAGARERLCTGLSLSLVVALSKSLDGSTLESYKKLYMFVVLLDTV
jgi:hypothetical protein